MYISLVLSGAAVCLIWILHKISRIGSRELFLPPGPPTRSIFGNVLSFPTHHPWYSLTAIARQYGDVYSLKMFSSTFIVISSLTAVREIMGKNAGIVSDRPPSHITQEITGGKHMGAARYSNEWRQLRRCGREVLTSEACRSHLSVQQAEATQLLYELLIKPEDFFDYIRRYSTSVILTVLYGNRAPSLATSEVIEFFEAEHHWQKINEIGAHPPIDLIPILKKVPERWASWKTEIKITRQLQRKLYFGLLERVERRVKQGASNGCFMEAVIEKAPRLGLDREAVGYVGGNLLEGGADTTSAVLQTVILALTNFPEAQRLAQEEIDRVVGDERAPVLDDIDKLPYIQALVKETHRWRPIAPLAVPHASIADVKYRNWVIPKGSTIFLNSWGIFHDPAIFGEPSVFNPGRWLKDDLISDHSYDLVFGCARRFCPGIHLAKNSININVMNFIWGFDFSKSKHPITKQDKVYDLHDFARGILTGPNRFECIITPRSAQRARIIKHDFLTASSIFETFERDLHPDDRAYVEKTRDELRRDIKS